MPSSSSSSSSQRHAGAAGGAAMRTDTPVRSTQDAIQASREDEIVSISDTYTPRSLLGYTILSVALYVRYLFENWARVLLSLPRTIFVDPFGAVTLVVFQAAANLILFAALIFTVLSRISLVQNLARRIFGAKNGVSFANIGYPNIFRSLTPEITTAAFRKLSQKGVSASSTLTTGSNESTTDGASQFDLDICKVLLWCSSLVYERRSSSLHNALQITKQCRRVGAGQHKRRDPNLSNAVEHGGRHANAMFAGDLLRQETGSDYRKVKQELADADRFIVETAREKLGMQYVSLSELSTKISAVCGAFYDERRNFILLAFKGTTPDEFPEWALDFTYAYTSARADIPGFRNVHKGFYEQLFRKEEGPGQQPYEVIVNSLQMIAKKMRERNATQNVNLWITGHSLGAATASLFYAKARRTPIEGITLRDAYVFGAPIICDPASLLSFNASMLDLSQQEARTNVWRVVNRGDAVATLLPSLGDKTASGGSRGGKNGRKALLGDEISLTNQLNYAHVGQLVKLKRSPRFCLFGPGTLLPRSSPITVQSDLPRQGQGPDVELALFSRVLPFILPFPLGRLIDHGPSWYWEHLSKARKTPEGDLITAL